MRKSQMSTNAGISRTPAMMAVWLGRPRALLCFFFSSRRRHTRWNCDWSSDVCSSDLNQLQAVNNWATYVYDARGNPVTRTLVGNGKHSDYTYDARDRVTSATHTLNVTRGFNYGYDANSDNRKYAKRTWTGLGEVFAYDLADQVTAVQHNIANPDTTPVPGQNIIYDSNGNRI